MSKTNDLMQSEAGLMLIAEELALLSNKRILPIVLMLAMKSPRATKEITRSGLWKPYRIKKMLEFLEDQGIIVKVRRTTQAGAPGKKTTKRFNHYFCADEFIACALDETMALLERNHQAFADGFRGLRNELSPPM